MPNQERGIPGLRLKGQRTGRGLGTNLQKEQINQEIEIDHEQTVQRRGLSWTIGQGSEEKVRIRGLTRMARRKQLMR